MSAESVVVALYPGLHIRSLWSDASWKPRPLPVGDEATVQSFSDDGRVSLIFGGDPPMSGWLHSYQIATLDGSTTEVPKHFSQNAVNLHLGLRVKSLHADSTWLPRPLSVGDEATIQSFQVGGHVQLRFEGDPPMYGWLHNCQLAALDGSRLVAEVPCPRILECLWVSSSHSGDPCLQVRCINMAGSTIGEYNFGLDSTFQDLASRIRHELNWTSMRFLSKDCCELERRELLKDQDCFTAQEVIAVTAYHGLRIKSVHEASTWDPRALNIGDEATVQSVDADNKIHLEFDGDPPMRGWLHPWQIVTLDGCIVQTGREHQN